MLKKAFLKKIKVISISYLFVFLLGVLALFRVITTPQLSTKDTNFKSQVLISQPVYIVDSRYRLLGDGYTINSFSVPKNLQMGDIVYVEGSRMYNAIYANKVSLVKPHLLKPLFLFKAMFVASTNQYFFEPYASLINGMLFGTDPNVPQPFKDQLISAGVIHTIVVSGYNISIIFAFLIALFKFLDKRSLTVLCVVFACLYALMVGFEPPVVRALIFGIAVFYSKAYGYLKNSLYILILSSLLMLIFSPLLVYSVSFLLTFSAAFGIIYLSPKLIFVLGKTPLGRFSFISESIASTTSAQIFVFPILMHFFNGVNLISLVCNPIVLWVIPYIMLFGAVFSIGNLLNLTILLDPFKFLIYGPCMFFVDSVVFFSGFKLNITTDLFKNSYFVITVYIFYSIFFVWTTLLSYNFKRWGILTSSHTKKFLKYFKKMCRFSKV